MIHPPAACAAPWFTQLQASSRLWHISEEIILNSIWAAWFMQKLLTSIFPSLFLPVLVSQICVEWKTISTSELLGFFWLRQNDFLCLSVHKHIIFHGILNFIVWQSTPKQLCAKESRKHCDGRKTLESQEAVFALENISILQFSIFVFPMWAQVKKPDISN